jgi:hypothetical protein
LNRLVKAAPSTLEDDGLWFLLLGFWTKASLHNNDQNSSFTQVFFVFLDEHRCIKRNSSVNQEKVYHFPIRKR